MSLFLRIAVAISLLVSTAAAADEPWGNLTMRFVHDGEPSRPGGRMTLEIEPGENDAGEYRLASALF